MPSTTSSYFFLSFLVVRRWSSFLPSDARQPAYRTLSCLPFIPQSPVLISNFFHLGTAQQWSVPGKKDKREKSTAPAGGATSSRDRERNEYGGTTSPRPGRGGRGGSARGGGPTRGRGGFPKGAQQGAHPVSAETVADESGSGDAGAWGQTDTTTEGPGPNGSAEKEKEKAPGE